MTKMNYSKLLGRIKECEYTQKTIAKKIGVSEGQFSQKLNGVYEFKQTEMNNLCEVLSIPAEEIGDYFFSPVS